MFGLSALRNAIARLTAAVNGWADVLESSLPGARQDLEYRPEVLDHQPPAPEADARPANGRAGRKAADLRRQAVSPGTRRGR